MAPRKKAKGGKKARCWLCCAISALKPAYVISNEDLFNAYKDLKLLHTTEFSSEENIIHLCSCCHQDFSEDTPGWIFLPTDLETFLEKEEKFQDRVSRAENGKKPERSHPEKNGDQKFIIYQVHENGVHKVEALKPSRERVWPGSPVLAIAHGAKALSYPVRLDPVEDYGIPDDVVSTLNSLLFSYGKRTPVIAEVSGTVEDPLVIGVDAPAEEIGTARGGDPADEPQTTRGGSPTEELQITGGVSPAEEVGTAGGGVPTNELETTGESNPAEGLQTARESGPAEELGATGEGVPVDRLETTRESNPADELGGGGPSDEPQTTGGGIVAGEPHTTTKYDNRDTTPAEDEDTDIPPITEKPNKSNGQSVYQPRATKPNNKRKSTEVTDDHSEPGTKNKRRARGVPVASSSNTSASKRVPPEQHPKSNLNKASTKGKNTEKQQNKKPKKGKEASSAPGQKKDVDIRSYLPRPHGSK